MNASPSKRPDAVSLVLVLTHLTFVFLPLYLALIWQKPWQLILWCLWFGVGMNGLLNLLHECAHLHVFRRVGDSIFLGRWVLAPLALADFDGYQKRHWDHHRKLGEETDPKYVYRVNVRGARFAAFFFRCLFLVEAVKKFSVQVPAKNNGGEAAKKNSSWIFRVLWVQAALGASLFLAALAAAGTGNFPAALQRSLTVYLAVYVYGIAAVAVFVSSLRAIAEHQIGNDGAITVGNAALRNFSFGFFSGFLLGAYGFKDHASHHLDPGLPYYRLESKTRELVLENPAFAPKTPYEKVLWSIIFWPARSSGPG